MKRCITANKYKIAALLIVLGLWWSLSRVYSPLVVPPIDSVALKVLEILKSPRLWTEIGRTVLRLIYGLGIGIGIGCAAGLIGGCIRSVKQLLIPVLGIIQVVPPISWLILAIIWFGLNGRASIFIVVMMVVPTMFICISDGITAIDRRLLEMQYLRLTYKNGLRMHLQDKHTCLLIHRNHTSSHKSDGLFRTVTLLLARHM